MSSCSVSTRCSVAGKRRRTITSTTVAGSTAFLKTFPDVDRRRYMANPGANARALFEVMNVVCRQATTGHTRFRADLGFQPAISGLHLSHSGGWAAAVHLHDELG